MHFTALLKSLDEFLYEVMSWLVFYPLTLWRVLSRPLAMMNYADRELHQQADEQYTDTLRPPIFLLISLLLSHALEIAVVGSNPLMTSKHGLSRYVHDDTSLIILRLVVFSIFPMLYALRLVRAEKKLITRDTLRQPFYAQCYAAAPFALMIGIGTLLWTVHWHWGPPTGTAIVLITLVAYGLTQARWFARHLHQSKLAGLGHATIGFVEGVLAIFLALPLFA